jgi:hypothetical protein
MQAEWRVDRGLAFPSEQAVAEGAAVCEYPRVELDVVEDAAVVEKSGRWR